MIDVTSVSFGYGDGRVLDAVDMHVAPGLTLLVGPNGCGKSTLLKIMAGVERPDEGRVTVGGWDLWRDEAAGRRGTVYVPEHPDLTPYASVIEVLRLVCRLRNEPLERATSLLEKVGLADRASASVRELSAGQRRRVLLAAAWVGRPRVALLDEPLELIDRHLRGVVLAWIDGLVAEGAAVIVVSHQIEPFLSTATFACTLREGHVVGPLTLAVDPSERLAVVERLARGGGVLNTARLS